MGSRTDHPEIVKQYERLFVGKGFLYYLLSNVYISTGSPETKRRPLNQFVAFSDINFNYLGTEAETDGNV